MIGDDHGHPYCAMALRVAELEGALATIGRVAEDAAVFGLLRNLQRALVVRDETGVGDEEKLVGGGEDGGFAAKVVFEKHVEGAACDFRQGGGYADDRGEKSEEDSAHNGENQNDLRPPTIAARIGGVVIVFYFVVV